MISHTSLRYYFLLLLILCTSPVRVLAQDGFRVVTPQQSERAQQAQQPERNQQFERPQQPARAERVQQPDRNQQAERPEQNEPAELAVAVQEAATVAPPAIAEVDAKLAEVTASDLGETVIATTKEMLQQTKLDLQAAEKLAAKAAAYRADVATAADNLASAKKEIDQKKPPTEIANNKNLAEVQLEYEKIDADLKTAREQLVAQSGEASRRQARLIEIPNLQTEAERKLEKILGQLKQVGSEGEPKLVIDARQMHLRAQLYLFETEVSSLESERKYYAATGELLPLQNELLQRKVERLQNRSAQFKALVEAKRENEIEKLQRIVKEQESKTPEVILAEAKINVELVEEYIADSKQLAKTIARSEKTRAAFDEIASEHKTSLERVEAVGLNETLGLMFRRSKSALAGRRRKFQTDGSMQEAIRRLQVESFRLQDLSKQASETEASITLLLDANKVPENQREALKEPVIQLLAQRRDVLSQLTQTKTELFNRLVALDVDRRKVVKEIDVYTDYINEHVLWIRSGAIVGRDDVTSFTEAVQWVGQPANWVALGQTFVEAIKKKFVMFGLLATTVLLLTVFKRRLRLNAEAAGATAEMAGCHSFMPTVTALINTLLIAALWPGILLSAGWLMLNVDANPFSQAAAKALIVVGLTLFPFEVLRHICRNHGLGQSHFGWDEDSRKYIRANLRLIVLTVPYLLFFIALLQYQPTEEFRNSLGRAIMVVSLLVISGFVLRIFHPRSQLYQGIIASHREDYWYRFRVVRFVVAIVVFAGLLLFTLGGYCYTTFQIGSRLIQTAALMIGVVLAYGTALRWLTVRRRKMKIEMLAARREELKRKQAAEASLGDGVVVDASAEPGLDANEVSEQAQELLMVSIGVFALWIGWQIWADVVPAVGILNRVTMWSVTIDNVSTPVTLQNLLHFVIAAAVTVFAVKNIPGILELLLLKRLPMDSGARYAVATIVRYILSVVGMIVAFAFLKVQWAQFSWLIAAISLGLGFGLQEIVANFVSGLILLLERPVRIGDVVTIEGTTGVVSKIQMRATTVTNWDQQELVVPNKNLITNSIFNWTLSNVLTRITLEFGVAYGTDPEHVKATVLDVVQSNPEVIGDPAPTVTFQTFGDSSLNFVVRCCISGPDKRLATIHKLQVAINNRLKEQNITIPFPQRVVHNFPEPETETTRSAQPVSPEANGTNVGI